MKTLRILLLAIFLVTSAFSVQPASADADHVLGYLPFLASVDPKLPVSTEALNAFAGLEPTLLELQASGALLGYQPIFEFGVIRLAYAPGADLSALGTVYASLEEAMSQVEHLTSDVAAQTLTITINKSNSCFIVNGVNPNSLIYGRVIASGKVIMTGEVKTDGAGYGLSCFFYPGIYAYIKPGQTIELDEVDPTGTLLLNTYTAVMPKFLPTAFNKANAVASGVAPAGWAYDIRWIHQDLNPPALSVTDLTNSGIASATGTWSEDFSDTITMRGGDQFLMTVTDPLSAFVFTDSAPWVYLPYISCAVGGYTNTTPNCRYNGPKKDVKLELTRGAAVTVFRPITAASPYPSWSPTFNFKSATGKSIILRPGNKVRILNSGMPQVKVPKVTVNIDYVNDVVSGVAPANSFLAISITQTTNVSGGFYLLADAAGNYSLDTTGVDLVTTSGQYILITSINVSNGNGFTYRFKFTP